MILCATDFSSTADAAVRVAALWARRLEQPLLLVHALPPQIGDRYTGELRSMQRGLAETLEDQAQPLRADGLHVETMVALGFADAEIVRIAAERKASLIVIGALGHRQGSHWLVGSTTERVAATTTVPMLVVRDAQPLESWLEGASRLSLLMATDLSEISDAALHWLRTLKPIGHADATLLYVANEPQEYARLDLGRPRFEDTLHPVADETLHRELNERAEKVDLGGEVKTRIALTLGRPSTVIVQAAAESQNDLIVVGSRQLRGLSRLWQGSVAQGVVHESSTNVLCIPMHTSEEGIRALEPPEVRSIVAATDFSPIGNRAVAWALALARGGARVAILHVASNQEERAAAWDELSRLKRTEAWPAEADVAVEIAEGQDVVRALLAAAERRSASLIVVGQRGQGALTRLMGSTASGLLRSSRKPVLIIPDESGR